MSKGKRLTELEKFKKACEAIDFTKVDERELDDVYVACMSKAKAAKKAAIEKQIAELQKQLSLLKV